MIVKEYHYDPKRDNTPVSQTGFVNLNDAYINHCIPSVIDDTDVAFNDIEDPSSILGKPGDVFEGYRMQAAVLERGKSSGESDVAGA